MFNHNITTKFFATVAAAISLSLIACSDDSKDTVHNLRAAPDLQGTFADTCSSSKILGVSEQIQLNFEGNNYTRSQIFYDESGCKNEIGRIQYVGEFKAGEQNPDNNNGGTLDLEVSKATIKVSSDTLATALNAINYCGHTDYASGKEVTLSGKQTEGLCPLENVPSTLYTAYKVESDNLFMTDSDISTMAKTSKDRSSTLDFNKAYLKR